MPFLYLATVMLLVMTSVCAESAKADDKQEPIAKHSYPEGQLLFMIQQGNIEKALKLYQSTTCIEHPKDYELLHQMALAILNHGFKQNDPEIQLLTLFGAIISASLDVCPLLEKGLNNSHPEIQLIALEGLAKFQDQRADLLLISALGSNSLLIRYESAKKLCQKKHPQAVAHVESLMYKTPESLWFAYPPLFAAIGNAQAIQHLKRLLNHSSKKVRLATVMAIDKFKLDDLTAQIRNLNLQPHYELQEACVHTLGAMQDELSVSKLKQLTGSQFLNVAIASRYALHQMGDETQISALQELAAQGNLMAITVLGQSHQCSTTLIDLMNNSDLQISLNAMLALLEQNQCAALEQIDKWILQNKQDIGYTKLSSPGYSITYWRATTSASQLFKNDTDKFLEHIEFKESLLKKVYELSQEKFLKLASAIFTNQQNELVPMVVSLLEEIETEESINCLKKHAQQFGAPYIRTYCALALYRLGEPGSHEQILRQFINNQSQNQFIRFEPFVPWKIGDKTYALTPEETSKLLIAICESLAARQEGEAIAILIDAMANGNEKNRYALAGLLLRATH